MTDPEPKSLEELEAEVVAAEAVDDAAFRASTAAIVADKAAREAVHDAREAYRAYLEALEDLEKSDDQP